MIRRSHPARVLRSLTALATVWCLGCNAFDPLISSLFPAAAGSMMVCASEAAAASAALHEGDGQAASVSEITDQGDRGTSCDCGSCYAPAPAAFASAQPPIAVPQQPALEPGLAPSFERTPLVPPPQAGA
jgi:hypothetical protein